MKLPIIGRRVAPQQAQKTIQEPTPEQVAGVLQRLDTVDPRLVLEGQVVPSGLLLPGEAQHELTVGRALNGLSREAVAWRVALHEVNHPVGEGDGESPKGKER